MVEQGPQIAEAKIHRTGDGLGGVASDEKFLNHELISTGRHIHPWGMSSYRGNAPGFVG